MWMFKAFRGKYIPCWESICIAENTGAIVRHPSAQSECCRAERSVSRKETKTKREAGGHANVNFSPPNERVFSALQRTHPRTSHFESQQHHHSIQTIPFTYGHEMSKIAGIHHITKQETLHCFCVTNLIHRCLELAKLYTDFQILFFH